MSNPQYKGALEPKQVAEGMTLALENAARLAADARLLLDNGRATTAVALAALSIEESGKVQILRRISIAEDKAEVKDLWRQYRRHTAKNTLWIFGRLVVSGARRLEDFRPIADPDSDHPEVLDRLKQDCLYTDCIGDAQWVSPRDIDIADLAPHLVKLAEILGAAKAIDVREIEAWRRHMAPVAGESFEAQKLAVAAWFQEMAMLGLSNATPEEVEAFLGGYGSAEQA